MKFDMSGGAAALEATAAIARARTAGAGRHGDRGDREPALRHGRQARRHRPRDGRHDDPGRQHRRRGPAGARRLSAARARAGRRAARRPGDAHGRRRHGARQRLRGRRSSTTRTGATLVTARGRARRRADLAPAAARALRGGRSRAATPTSPTRPAERKAQPISGAEFLHHFAGDVPWAHLDIAGVANDSGLAYLGPRRHRLGRAAARGPRRGARGRGSPRRVRRHALRPVRRDRAAAPHRARLRR